MPRFVTIGYGDRAGYDRTQLAIRDAAHDRWALDELTVCSLVGATRHATTSRALRLGLYPGQGGVSPRPGVMIDPGPWMTRNQNVKAIPQTAAVHPKIRTIAPVRWS